jgi:hypothetical protein
MAPVPAGGCTSSQLVRLACNYRALNCIQTWFVSLIISTFIVQEAVDTLETEVQVPAAVEINECCSCFKSFQ